MEEDVGFKKKHPLISMTHISLGPVNKGINLIGFKFQLLLDQYNWLRYNRKKIIHEDGNLL